MRVEPKVSFQCLQALLPAKASPARHGYKIKELSFRVWVALSLVVAVGAGAQEVHPPVVEPQASVAANNAHRGPGGTVEYWDVLPLSGNTLHPLAPVHGETATLPKFTRELIRVEWRFGDPIDLYVIRPIGVAKPPVVLYLYSFPTDTDRFLDDKLCEKLTKDGFAAVGFVSALTGQRYHDRPMKEWFVSELPEALGLSVHDVQMLLNYLDTRGDLDMQHVGMFGQGSGGTVAILSAAVDARIKAVDVIDPWGDWPEWLAKSPQVPDEERVRLLTPAFLASVAPLDPLRWMDALSARPFRLEETLFSLATPQAARKSLERAKPASAAFVAYKNVDQYLRDASTDGKILDWLHKQLALDSALP